jgi:hypothetical protein
VLSKNILKRQILLSQLCWHKELNYHIQQTKNNLFKKREKTNTGYKPKKSMGKENQTNLKKERVFQLYMTKILQNISRWKGPHQV